MPPREFIYKRDEFKEFEDKEHSKVLPVFLHQISRKKIVTSQYRRNRIY